MRNILIIKHGALGDIILASGAFTAIRKAYPSATIHVLTTERYKALLSACPAIDAVMVDQKPRPWQLGRLCALRQHLRHTPWDLVIDLQCSTRSSSYWWLLSRPKPAWCGAAWGASLRYRHQHDQHAFSNLKQQLQLIGIDTDITPNIDWLKANITRFDVPASYCLLVPGAAPHRPRKRWPHYAALAHYARVEGITPVLIGGEAEADICAKIAAEIPAVINLCGKTTIPDIAGLAAHAAWAVGNDTGPMHIIAAAGCPSLVLFSDDSAPERSAPPAAKTLQRATLDDLEPETVWQAVQSLDMKP
jgi:ADP-heptose:LPS heptosyltransferase